MKADKYRRIFFVMGVSGSGKSTIGQELSRALSLQFFDGDDYHPRKNVAKMSAGAPLDDEDRKPWLEAINTLAKKHSHTGAVIACSALKKKYRSILEKGILPNPVWIYLSGSFETIAGRLEKRKEHFMPPALLRSQFDSLEVPEGSIEVPVTLPPETMVKEILRELEA
jgi:gluconokinase